MSEFEYWYIGFVASSTALFATVFIVLHSHVWIRNGYAGKNKILELPEVDRFVAHVISEASLVMLWLITTVEPLVFLHMNFTYPKESKYLLFFTFLGSGVYIAFRSHIRKILKLDEIDTKE